MCLICRECCSFILTAWSGWQLFLFMQETCAALPATLSCHHHAHPEDAWYILLVGMNDIRVPHSGHLKLVIQHVQHGAHPDTRQGISGRAKIIIIIISHSYIFSL